MFTGGKDMEKYEPLEIEVTVFEEEDVITTSGGDEITTWPIP